MRISVGQRYKITAYPGDELKVIRITNSFIEYNYYTFKDKSFKIISKEIDIFNSFVQSNLITLINKYKLKEKGYEPTFNKTWGKSS